MAKTLKTILKLEKGQFKKDFKGVQKSVAKFQRDYGRQISKIATRLAVVGVAGAAAFGLIAYKALNASGQIDTFKLALKTATGSAIAAKKAYAETFETFVRSPMMLQPLIKARVLLESFGIRGKAALDGVTAAASLLQRAPEDIAMALGSMETRPIRRLGVQLAKVGEQFSFAFRDQQGKKIQMVIHGIEEARMAMVKILNLKFGGLLEAMARGTFTGAMSTFGGVAWAASAQFGDGFKKNVISSLVSLNDHLEKLLRSGFFYRMDQKFAEVAKSISESTRKIIIAFTSMSERSRNKLQRFMMVLGGVAIGFKTGLLQPILIMLASLTTAIVKTGANMVAGLLGWKPSIAGAVALVGTAIGAGIAGWAIGKFLDKQFDFSGRIAKWALQAKLGAIQAANAIEAMDSSKGEFLGMEVSSAATDEFLGMIPVVGKAWDSISTKSAKEVGFLKTQIALLDEEIKKNMSASPGLVQNLKDTGEETLDMLTTGLAEVAKMIKAAALEVTGLDDLLAKMGEVNLPDMTELPTFDPTGLEQGADAVAQMKKDLLPLRGFLAGGRQIAFKRTKKPFVPEKRPDPNRGQKEFKSEVFEESKALRLAFRNAILNFFEVPELKLAIDNAIAQAESALGKKGISPFTNFGLPKGAANVPTRVMETFADGSRGIRNIDPLLPKRSVEDMVTEQRKTNVLFGRVLARPMALGGTWNP